MQAEHQVMINAKSSADTTTSTHQWRVECLLNGSALSTFTVAFAVTDLFVPANSYKPSRCQSTLIQSIKISSSGILQLSKRNPNKTSSNVTVLDQDLHNNLARQERPLFMNSITRQNFQMQTQWIYLILCSWRVEERDLRVTMGRRKVIEM
jgi:hypothetical protein